MGQDSEAAAEFVATVRGDHAKMKEWYTQSAPADLKDKYGDYPGLWKEVLNWPGWKDARREYLKHTQQNSNESNGGGGGNNESIPRKRKSRWGSKTETNNNTPNNNNNQNNNNGTGRNPQAPPPEKRPAVVTAPALNLPGIQLGSANYLSPQQQEELRRLQEKLRRVNERLDNLEREAARVDALPRGHRDRSPSPPPSKYTRNRERILGSKLL